MKKRIILFSAVLILGIWGCSKHDQRNVLPKTVNVQINVVSDLATRSNPSKEENKVNAFDLFLFDSVSGLLEEVKQNIAASTPTNGNVAGEQKVGEVSITLRDNKPKNVLVVANPTTTNVVYPTIELNVTTYSDMMESVTKLDNGAVPSSPFVMGGHLNRISVGENPAVTVSLCRRVSKILINNLSSETLVINSLKLTQLIDKAFLFKKGDPISDVSYVDYDVVNSASATFYVFPQTADGNKIILEVEGTLDGNPISQTLEIVPKDSQGNSIDMDNNTNYTVKLKAEAKAIIMELVANSVEEWIEGQDIYGIIIPKKPADFELITFNGLQWMDRNLGATSADFENDWDNAIGNFYQWGRNVEFTSNQKIETISGPLTAQDANSGENSHKFINIMKGDWLSSTDNSRWQSIANQPCPEGYRVPTVTDYMGIFTLGALVNTYGGPVIKTENLSGGSFSAHYWGDKRTTMYAIKKVGDKDAYFMKWEWLKTSGNNFYVKISRWLADESATFIDKNVNDIADEFVALGEALEVISLPAAGNITGSNGNYSKGAPGGYYWSSSLNGDGAHRAEFTSGKMIAGDVYNSRVSGHSIRCIKE